MLTADHFLEAAGRAAPGFGLEPTAIEIMSHSENVVCRIDLADGTKVAMRLHRPGYNTHAELESEVLWVASLAEAGLPVPVPLPRSEGGHYELVEVGSGADIERRHVGVVKWVEGEPLGGPVEGANGNVVQHFATIGGLTAQIREHNSSWTPPPGFIRRRWDADNLVGDSPLWGRFWEAGRLTTEQQSLFSEARTQLWQELSDLSTGPDRFGLIHSDLHLGNLMAAGDALTLIDFDDAGFGWFAHELAVSLHPGLGEPWLEPAKAALIDGYRSVYALDDEEVALIDTFLVVRSLMIIGWLDARPELEVQKYFPVLAEAAAGSVHRYLGRS